jgi:hypothetical protein
LGYEHQELLDLNMETSGWSGKVLLRDKNGSVLALETQTSRASMGGLQFYIIVLKKVR